MAKVYVRILAKAGLNSRGGAPTGPVDVIEQELDILTNALETLSTYFLVAGVYSFYLCACSISHNFVCSGDYTKRLKQDRADLQSP